MGSNNNHCDPRDHDCAMQYPVGGCLVVAFMQLARSYVLLIYEPIDHFV